MKATVSINEGSDNTAEKIKQSMRDCKFFVNEYGWTFDPRPEAYPHHLRFELYPFQEELIEEIVDAVDGKRSLMIEKSRDMGVSWTVLYVIYWMWKYRPGFQALLGSRIESEVDSKSMKSLFAKLDYMIEKDTVWPKGFNPNKHRTNLTLINPQNGNAIIGESSNPNFGRGGRFTLVLLDEMAFWENPEAAWSSCGESTKCRIAVTTPPPKPNFAKYLRFSGVVKVLTYLWKRHPLKDEAWYAHQKLTKLPTELASEVDLNWEGAVTGRVYPEVAHVITGEFPYRPDWPLYISHDPGHKPDPHALQWWQVDPKTYRKRLIASFEANNKLAAWFLPMFGKPISSEFSYTPEELEFIAKVSQWKPAIHFGDQAGRQQNESSGQSVYDVFAEHGIYVQSNTKANDLESRKTAMKRILMECDIDDTKENRYVLECWKDARYPDLSASSNRITPNDKPVHDWTSHHRTCTEYFSVNWKPDEIKEPDRMAGTFLNALRGLQSNQSDEYVIQP